MKSRVAYVVNLTVTILALISATAVCASASAKVVGSYIFNGTNGSEPLGGVILDSAGNIYGTTVNGGALGYGMVYEVIPNKSGSWTEKTLYSFKGYTDGSNPSASLIFDSAGNLYGTTTGQGGGNYGYGTVFKLTPGSGSWTETVLWSFTGGNDGGDPRAGVIFDSNGNLYGTTWLGGTSDAGTVFELSPGQGAWTESVLHNFKYSGPIGYSPFGSLVFDQKGNLYGTNSKGGASNAGTVFELTPGGAGAWGSAVLHNFKNNGQDGVGPMGALIFDGKGNLYGTTVHGGAGNGGVVFELIANSNGKWSESVLHSFAGGTDGYDPQAGLVFDKSGNLYGTTVYGGGNNYGAVFELSPSGSGWSESVLYGFKKTSGHTPESALILDSSGNLYGTNILGGGFNAGTLFEMVP